MFNIDSDKTRQKLNKVLCLNLTQKSLNTLTHTHTSHSYIDSLTRQTYKTHKLKSLKNIVK